MQDIVFVFVVCFCLFLFFSQITNFHHHRHHYYRNHYNQIHYHQYIHHYHHRHHHQHHLKTLKNPRMDKAHWSDFGSGGGALADYWQ